MGKGKEMKWGKGNEMKGREGNEGGKQKMEIQRGRKKNKAGHSAISVPVARG